MRSNKFLKIGCENGVCRYLGDDTLLLFNTENGHVYGFEKEEAARVLELDEYRKRWEGEEKREEFFKELPETWREIVKILEGKESVARERYEPPLRIGSFMEKRSAHTVTHRLGDVLRVHLNYPDRALMEMIEPQFEHLKDLFGAVKREVRVDFLSGKDGRWRITFNDTPIATGVARETLPLVLQENLVILYYQTLSYLMAIHAAAVARGSGGVIFPAVSGSGKSTLTVALLARGYRLLSDEIAWVGREGKVSPLPFALNIKEGSWKVVERLDSRLGEMPVHLRFDGQRVRLLPPKGLTDRPVSLEALVFPKFQKGVSVSLRPLGVCETLRKVKEAGYQLQRPLNEADFEKILEHLLSKPSYELIYDDLDDAVRNIERVLHE